jgi:hypothetical protein
MHWEPPLWTLGSDQQANHQVQQGSDTIIRTQDSIRHIFKNKAEREE